MEVSLGVALIATGGCIGAVIGWYVLGRADRDRYRDVCRVLLGEQARADDLREMLDDEIARREDGDESANSVLENELEAAERAAKASEKRAKVAESERVAVENELETATAEIELARHSAAESTKARDDAKAELKDALERVRQLETQISELGGQDRGAEQRVATLERELETAKADRSSAKTQIEELRATLAVVEEAATDPRGGSASEDVLQEVSELRQQLAAANAETERARSDKDELQKQTTDAQNELKALRKQIESTSSLESRALELESQIAELESLVESRETELLDEIGQRDRELSRIRDELAAQITNANAAARQETEPAVEENVADAKLEAGREAEDADEDDDEYEYEYEYDDDSEDEEDSEADGDEYEYEYDDGEEEDGVAEEDGDLVESPTLTSKAETATEAKSESKSGSDEETLDLFPNEPRADDLKVLPGVGPALEKKLNELGFRRFDQLAALDDSGVDELGEQLGHYASRIRRHRWIELSSEQQSS